MSNPPTAESIDYNRLTQANLMRVFNESDAGRRIVAIRELYADDGVLYEPEASARGHAPISGAVSHYIARPPASERRPQRSPSDLAREGQNHTEDHEE